MRRSMSVTILFSCLIISCIFSINLANAIETEFTHSVFIENFSNVESPLCIEEQRNIKTLSEKFGHRFHIVDFHLQDKWSNIGGYKRASELNMNLVPSYSCDGGYELRIGENLNEDTIKVSGNRVVHKIGLSVDKEIVEQQLRITCTVVERNGFSFDGEVIVFITEDHLISDSVEWNGVFRDYGMREYIELKPNSFKEFIDLWDIPKNVNYENIRVVAAVLDVDQYEGSYFVQSACDEDEKIIIPEFSSPYPIIIIINLIAAIIVSRIIKRDYKFNLWR